MHRTPPPSAKTPRTVPIHLTELIVYRFQSPETDCEHAYLAAPADRSVLLSFGNSAIYFDLEFPREGQRWLDDEYGATPERLYFDILGWAHAVEKPFPGGVYFGMIQIDPEGRPTRLELSTKTQRFADDGPEYERVGPGEPARWRRWHSPSQVFLPISADERHMLERAVQIFAPLVAQTAHLISAEPTPRFRGSGTSHPPPRESSHTTQ